MTSATAKSIKNAKGSALNEWKLFDGIRLTTKYVKVKKE
jgi:hypothetical protein